MTGSVPTWVVLLGGIGALVSAVLVFVVALRRTAGTVKHSEAEQLWTAMQKFTEELSARNEFLRKTLDECAEKIDNLEQRIDGLEEKNRKLYLENGTLRRMNTEHEKTIVELRDQLHRQSEDNAELRAEIVVLRGRVKELEAQNESR